MTQLRRVPNTIWVILIIGFALVTRLIAITFTPSDWDDWIYRLIGMCQNMLGYPNVCTAAAGPTPEPFLFHPPFHFKLLGWWIGITGNDSIGSLRVLSCIIATLLIAMVMYLVWYITKHKGVANLTGFVLAVDGWFHYSSILVKFDVMTCLIGMFGVFLVVKSLENNSRRTAILAGLAIGFTAVYKHIGGIFFLGVLLQWLLSLGLEIRWDWRRWRELRERQWNPYRTIVVTAILVGVIYLIGMTLTYHQLFIENSWVQIKRTFGFQNARGLNYGPVEAFQALANTYWAFGGTILFALFSVLCVIKRTADHLRGRYLWLAPITMTANAALIILAVIRLRNPHYVHYALIPAYIVGCVQIMEWWIPFRRVIRRSKHWSIFRWAIVGGLILVLMSVMNLRTFVIRLTDFSGNDSYVAVQDYVRQNFPPDFVIIADQSFCYSMPERDCRDASNFETIERIAAVNPNVIVIQDTATQHPPDSIIAWSAKGQVIFSSVSFKGPVQIILMP